MNDDQRARLRVFMGDELLGELERRGPTRYSLTYDPRVVEQRGEGSILLSASLPLREEPYPNAQTKPFFEGLLPEGVARREVARAVGVSESNGFSLLEAIGAECAGAVVVLPPEAGPPGQGSITWLSDAEVEEKLRDLPQHPLGINPEEGIRLSLGGVQHKLIVVRAPNGQIGQPVAGAPSTHIIKPAQDPYPDVVANEAFGLRVAACAELDVARAEIVRIGEFETLLVERYDRSISDSGAIVRLHQEDMCQALGVLPSAKYESEGGPSLIQVFGLLREVGTARDLQALAMATLVNFLLGNSDAHGKNLSLLYDRPGGVRLAPLYDVLSTAVYPALTRRLAMSIAGTTDPDEVDHERWLEMLREAGFRPQEEQLRRDVTRVIECAQRVLEISKAERWHRPLLDGIVQIVEERGAQLVGAGVSTR
jgi:serine/threonine-protein kinase HipA